MARESETTEFITARLDEAEAVTRSCIDEVGTDRKGDSYPDGSGDTFPYDDYPSYPWGSGERELAYMASTQPRFRLREIDAMRKLLEAHVGYYGPGDDEFFPVPTLRILAAIWADHEDYPAALKAEGVRHV